MFFVFFCLTELVLLSLFKKIILVCFGCYCTCFVVDIFVLCFVIVGVIAKWCFVIVLLCVLLLTFCFV